MRPLKSMTYGGGVGHSYDLPPGHSYDLGLSEIRADMDEF